MDTRLRPARAFLRVFGVSVTSVAFCHSCHEQRSRYTGRHVKVAERQTHWWSSVLGTIVTTGYGTVRTVLGRVAVAAACRLAAIGPIRCQPGFAGGRIGGGTLSQSRRLSGGRRIAAPHQPWNHACGAGEALCDLAQIIADPAAKRPFHRAHA